MITGGAAWTNALNAQQKQPLWVFTIPGKAIKLCNFFPLNQAVNAGSCLPILNVPKGASQSVDELNGHSSISSQIITAVDPSGALKSLAAATDVIGQKCQLLLGFPGGDITDITQFVPIETYRIAKQITRDEKGLMQIPVQDILMDVGNQIFLNGGPSLWTQWTGNAKVSLTSSAAGDTRSVTIVGWNTAGTALLTEVVALTGTVEVLSANTYSSIISITVVVATMLWTVTVKQGSGGTTRGTIPKGSTVIGGPLQTPSTTSLLDNGFPISDTNPRYFVGNPIDLILAGMQNELGIGQAAPPVLVIQTGGGSGTGAAGYGINPTWTFYDGTSNLINPNTFMDVPGLLNLKSSQFANDWLEFKLTGSEGRSWIESELMKICALYWITRGDGKLSPKSMKHPANPTTVSISDHHMDGIPATDVWPIINIIEASVTDDDGNTIPITFAQQASLNKYKAPYVHTIDSAGLRLGRGAFGRLFLLANLIFNRHAFGTPIYTFSTFFKHLVVELGDFFSLTHSKLLDQIAGTVGVTNALCEVIRREPDYTNQRYPMRFSVIDTRFILTSNGAFEIAAAADAIPDYPAASGGQRAQYIFVTNNVGQYSTGAAGNQIQ